VTDQAGTGALVGGTTNTLVRQCHRGSERTCRVATGHRGCLISDWGRARGALIFSSLFYHPLHALLQENIKKYSRLILLSPSIYHYKGKVPREYVIVSEPQARATPPLISPQKIILKHRFGIPPNIETNGYAWAKVTVRIDHELSQARGRLKKIVNVFSTRPPHSRLTKIDQLKGGAGAGDAQSQPTIYQLTQTMVGGENYKLSPAICTRVAIMVRGFISKTRHYLTGAQRQVYSSVHGGDYWDQVDKILDSIKSMAEERRFRYVVPARFDYSRSLRFPSSYLKAILSRDRRRYGVESGNVATPPSDVATTGEKSVIQQSIEDLVEAPGGVAVSQDPHNELAT